MKRRRAGFHGWVLALAVLVQAPVFAAEAPLEPDEIRERRLFRAERPLWQEALALPRHLVTVVTWPLKHALFWAEDVRLDRRVRDVVMYPVDAFRDSESDE